MVLLLTSIALLTNKHVIQFYKRGMWPLARLRHCLGILFTSVYQGQSSMATLHQPRRTKNNELDPVYHNLPRQSLPKSLSVGDFLDVIVAEVFSPGHFFIQAKETSGLLDKMMDSMEEFYYKNHQKERYRITDLSVGLICVSLFNDGNWYRASVTKVVDDTLVEVQYITRWTQNMLDLYVKKSGCLFFYFYSVRMVLSSSQVLKQNYFKLNLDS